jgi:hypothetical protein
MAAAQCSLRGDKASHELGVGLLTLLFPLRDPNKMQIRTHR